MNRWLLFVVVALFASAMVGCGGNGIGGTITDPGHTGTYTID